MNVHAAAASRVSVIVAPPPAACRCALGLLVPGAGPTVSREGALAALLRGRVQSSLLGGVPGGRPLIRLARRPGPTTIYVTLPPPGRHHNVHRHPIAIAGPGYRGGLLTSSSTRIRGLVSIADVAPTALALERGERPVLTSEAAASPERYLRRLDRRLARVHDLRIPATLVVVSWMLLLLWGRSALLVPVAALGVSLVLSAIGATDPWVVVPLLAVATLAGSVLAVRALPLAVAAFLGAFLLVLAVFPETNSLSAIGPHPDGGGRYYGITNQVETLLLAPTLAAVAVLRPRLAVPLAVLALVTVGWSRAGADGGGAVVLVAGLLALALRRRGLALAPRRLALVAAGAVVLALALVGLDAAAGGSSHVTRAVGSGPRSLLGDLGHRLHVSYAGATSTWWAAFTVCLCLLVLVWFATRRRRFATVDALLVALAVSLVVNDTATEIAWFGALSCGALWSWERARASLD